MEEAALEGSGLSRGLQDTSIWGAVSAELWGPPCPGEGAMDPQQVGRLGWRVVGNCGHPVAEWVGSEVSALERPQGRRAADGPWGVRRNSLWCVADAWRAFTLRGSSDHSQTAKGEQSLGWGESQLLGYRPGQQLPGGRVWGTVLRLLACQWNPNTEL